MKTKLPDNFTPDENTLQWALKKYGYYDLPDYFLSDFRRHHAAKGTKYEDWDKALQNWVIWSSPNGRFYQAKVWEDALAYCKKKINSEAAKIPLPVIKKPPKPVDREAARNHMKKIRMMLNESKC